MKRFEPIEYMGYKTKQLLLLILKNQFSIMAKQDQFEAVLTRIDAATNKIAADLSSLKDEVKNAGLDASTEDSIVTKLEAAAAKLEGIGADPADPVPDPVEPPTEPPTEEPV